MKKFLFVFSTLTLASIGANASIVACDSVNPVNYATWSTQFVGAGNGCQLGDKVFTNFSLGLPTTASLTFGVSGDGYTINFTNTSLGGFTANFTESYDIAICYAPCLTGTAAPNSNYKIVRVAGGLQDSNGNGNASLVKTVSGGASGVATATDVNGTITPVALTGISASSLHVVENFTRTSGVITNISNTFTQADTTVPEPTTAAMLGCALIGLGLLRRR